MAGLDQAPKRIDKDIEDVGKRVKVGVLSSARPSVRRSVEGPLFSAKTSGYISWRSHESLGSTNSCRCHDDFAHLHMII